MANWRDQVSTSSGGNINMYVQGGHGDVSRSGNTVSFSYGVRFQKVSSWTSNGVAAFPGGTRYWAKSGQTQMGSGWHYASSTSSGTYKTESIPMSYSTTVSGGGAGTITMKVGVGWDAWTPNNAWTYTFYVDYPAATYWNDINAWNPDRSSQNGATFDLYVSESNATYRNLTNENSDMTHTSGTYFDVFNVRAPAHQYISDVTGEDSTTTREGYTAYRKTFDGASESLDIYTAWNRYWNNINVFNPSGNEDSSAAYFDLYTSENNSWRYNLGNEDSDMTHVYGSYFQVQNIRPRQTYYYVSNVTGHDSVPATGAYRKTFDAANEALNIYLAYNSYTVTLRRGTGIADIAVPWAWKDSTYKQESQVYGTSITLGATVNTGYHWVNWTGTFTTSTNNYTFSVGAQAYDLTANAAPNTYTVVYNGNGANGATASSSHTYNSAKNLTTNGFVKQGYTFRNWNTAANGSGTTYTNGQSVTNLTATDGGTVTLYAQWDIVNLPSTSVGVSNIMPKSFDITSTTSGTVSYVSTKYCSDAVRNWLKSYSDMPMKVLSDGSVWTRVYYHDSRAGSVLWAKDANQATNIQEANRYSRLGIINDNFKDGSGKYEFMLCYPTNLGEAYNRWKQTKRPQDEKISSTTGGTTTGYEAVHIDWTDSYWGGLELNGTDDWPTYIDGSVGHGNWFYAIAPTVEYNGGMPGVNNNGIIFRQAEIWMRLPGVTGILINVSANSTVSVSDLDDESTYIVCSRTTNGAGAAYSTTMTYDTPVDQAKSMIKKDGNWVLGKTYIKINGVWVKAKKIYIKKNGQWVVNVNPRN